MEQWLVLKMRFLFLLCNDFTKRITFSIVANFRVLVDGGANRWFKFIDENDLNDSIAEPSCICGDMDSISQESIDRLTNMNIEFVHTPDQDDTDLTKALIISRPFIDNVGVNMLKKLPKIKNTFLHLNPFTI